MPGFFKLIPKRNELRFKMDASRFALRSFGTPKPWLKTIVDDLSTSLFSYSLKQSLMELSLFSKPANFTDVLIQGEMGITSSTAEQFIIGSLGAKNTVILLVYNPETKVAAVAHVDGWWTIGYALMIIEEAINKNHASDLMVDLSTANLESNDLLESIKLELNKRDHLHLRGIHQSASLYINAKTGKLVNYKIYRDLYMNVCILERQIDIRRGIGSAFPLSLKFDFRDMPINPVNEYSIP